MSYSITAAVPVKGSFALTRRALPTLPRAGRITCQAAVPSNWQPSQDLPALLSPPSKPVAASDTTSVDSERADSIVATTGDELVAPITLAPLTSAEESVQAAVIVGVIVFSSFWGTALPLRAEVIAHVAATSLWFGVNVWTTCFAGQTIFKTLPDQKVESMQMHAKLFPMYFGVISACCALLLSTLCFGNMHMVSTYHVMSMVALGLVTSLSNLFFIEPAVASTRLERDQEINDTDIPNIFTLLTKRSDLLQGISTLSMFGNLVASVSHIIWIASLISGLPHLPVPA